MARLIFTTILILVANWAIHAQNSTSTKGKEFWVGFLESLPEGMNCLDGECVKYYVQVLTEQETTVDIYGPANNYHYKVTCYPDKINFIRLDYQINWSVEGVDVKHSAGILVKSLADIELMAFQKRIYFSEGTYVLPITHLGSRYTVLALKDPYEIDRSGSAFCVVSTEDNTKVRITPSCDILSGKQANVPYDVVLQKGEVYQLRSRYCDLSGSKVEAYEGKNIAVFSGSKTARVYSPDCEISDDVNINDNHIYDQILPDYLCGNKHVLAPYLTYGKASAKTLVKIVSLQDNNRILISGLIDTIIAKNQTLMVYIGKSHVLESTENVTVGTFISSYQCYDNKGDPALSTLPPLAYLGQNYKVCNLSTLMSYRDQAINVLTLVFPDGKPTYVYMNGQDASSISEVIIKEEFIDNIYIVNYRFGLEFNILKCLEIVTDKQNQARWSSYAPYDAYTSFLGFAVPGLDEKNEEVLCDGDNVRIYPVPVTQSQIKVEIKSNKRQGQALINIYNMLGQLCQSYAINYDLDEQQVYNLSLAGLASASYHMKVNVNANWTDHRMIVLN